MSTTKATARMIGILYIVASAAAVVGGLLIWQVLDDPTDLADAAASEGQVVLGGVLELVLAVSVFAIAALFFPLLKRHHEGMALSYFGVRILEGVIIAIGTITSLALLALSQGYGADVAESGAQPLADVLAETRVWTDLLGPMIVFSLSALILYPMLYRTRLIPGWLSIWGLVGGALLLIRGLLLMFGIETATPISVTLTAPIGIQEMAMAVWLIVRGFNQPAHLPEPVEERLPVKV